MTTERSEREELVPASLESAAQELGASVEQQVTEILEAAKARAAEIEAEALRKVRETGGDSQQDAERLLTFTIERTRQMLAAIDSAETRFAGTLDSLRTETESLRAEAEELLAGVHGARPVEADPPAVPPPSPSLRPVDHSLVLDIIREQLQRMYLDETPRTEAEHFVTNFAQGAEYQHLVDEVYSVPRKPRERAGKAGFLERLRRRGRKTRG